MLLALTTGTKEGEPLFAFYDRVARPEFEACRSIVEGWWSEMWPADAVELARQMRESEDLGHESGLAEGETSFTYELLKAILDGGDMEPLEPALSRVEVVRREVLH